MIDGNWPMFVAAAVIYLSLWTLLGPRVAGARGTPSALARCLAAGASLLVSLPIAGHAITDPLVAGPWEACAVLALSLGSFLALLGRFDKRALLAYAIACAAFATAALALASKFVLSR